MLVSKMQNLFIKKKKKIQKGTWKREFHSRIDTPWCRKSWSEPSNQTEQRTSWSISRTCISCRRVSDKSVSWSQWDLREHAQGRGEHSRTQDRHRLSSSLPCSISAEASRVGCDHDGGAGGSGLVESLSCRFRRRIGSLPSEFWVTKLSPPLLDLKNMEWRRWKNFKEEKSLDLKRKKRGYQAFRGGSVSS